MRSKTIIIYSIVIALSYLAANYDSPMIIDSANQIAWGFVTCLKWLSIPLISLSILVTTAKLKNRNELVTLGLNVLKYTLITTIIAAAVALGYFLLINPANPQLAELACKYKAPPTPSGMFGYLLISTLLITLISSSVLVSLADNVRKNIHSKLEILYRLVLKIIGVVLMLMPVAIWAFITLFIQDVNTITFKCLLKYLLCIVAANLTQALIVLPLFLRWKNIPIISSFQGMLPALSVAFWTKSSGVALPVAVQCARENLKISDRIAGFSLPLCITINMNACAAFILTTVLFVSISHGASYSVGEYLAWILAASLAAVGNAGVPMGCYTLACALLAYIGAPLYLLGMILPVYAMIDMLESAINVWSDTCVTLLVERDSKTNY